MSWYDWLGHIKKTTCKLNLGRYVPIRPIINTRFCDIAFHHVKCVLYMCHKDVRC